MSQAQEPAAPPEADGPAPVFTRLAGQLARAGLPYAVHAHEPVRTAAEATAPLPFDVARLVKTVAFRTRAGGLVLAAVQCAARVDYARLAAMLGVNRRDLAPLSPEEVRERLGVEPGSVSPLPLAADVTVCIDTAVLTLGPTVFCGSGRLDRTLEIAPEDLVRLASGRTGQIAR